jgi:hypothetical protein
MAAMAMVVVANDDDAGHKERACACVRACVRACGSSRRPTRRARERAARRPKLADAAVWRVPSSGGCVMRGTGACAGACACLKLHSLLAAACAGGAGGGGRGWVGPQSALCPNHKNWCRGKSPDRWTRRV